MSLLAQRKLKNGYRIDVEHNPYTGSITWQAYKDGETLHSFTHQQLKRFPKFVRLAGLELWKAVTTSQPN